MTAGVTPINSIGSRAWDIVSTPIRAPFAAVGGGIEGYQAFSRGASEIATSATTTNSIAEMVCNFLRKHVGNLFANGLTKIGSSEVIPAVGNAFKNLNVTGLASKLGAAGPAGLLLLGAHVAIAATAVSMGSMLAYRSYRMLDNDSLGWSMHDITNSKSIHTAQTVAGLGTALGGAMCFINPAIGLGTVALGFIGSKATDIYKHLHSGINWFNTPRTAPLWWRAIFGESFRNTGLTNGSI